MNVVFVTVVPSPYQRDLFGAMAARNDLDLKVYYLEAASPDSPWPQKQLRPFEKILPGFWLPFAGARWFFNWRLPDFSDADFVVLSSFASWTGQRLMRRGLRGKRWLFWGERLRSQGNGLKGRLHSKLLDPLGNAAAIVGIGRLAEQDYAKRFPSTRHFNVPYYCDLREFQGRVSRDECRGTSVECRGTSDLRPPTSDFRPPTSDPHPSTLDPRPSTLPFTFLFCGQMIARKGVDLLLAAFDQLIAKGCDAQLLLVGREADLPRLLETINPATRSRVRYEGFQPPEKLPEYFSRADVFVLPSRHDGWGVVVNQALGAGLPLLCSDAVGAAHDLIEPEVNGLIFPSGNVTELTRSIERLAKDPGTTSAWGAASHRKAADWSPKSGAQKWAEVFEALK